MREYYLKQMKAIEEEERTKMKHIKIKMDINSVTTILNVNGCNNNQKSKIVSLDKKRSEYIMSTRHFRLKNTNRFERKG